MIEQACSEKRFLHDVREHKIEVVRDDGKYRHIRFRRESSSVYWFDIITWPGYLCLTGDCGTNVFCRVEDMLTFFRDGAEGDLRINPGYWGEKCRAQDGDGIKEYSPEKFRESIKEWFDQYVEEYDQANDDLWDDIESSVLYHADDGHVRALDAAMGFHHGDFSFQDFWEYDVTTYKFHYLWNIYAIVWGIREYDAEKSNV
jgi:hypothetical protein